MRIFSALYFFIRKAVILVAVLSYKFLQLKVHSWLVKVIWFPLGTLFSITAHIIILIRPYQKDYMNCLDTLILSYSALVCFALASELPTPVIVRTMLFVPITVFILAIVPAKIWKSCKVRILLILRASLNRCCECFLIERIRTFTMVGSNPSFKENGSETVPIARAENDSCGIAAIAVSYGSNSLVPYTYSGLSE